MQFFKRKKEKHPPVRSALFVCTANITRSPSAEALFKLEIEKTGEIWDISSAGVNAVKGIRAQKNISILMHLNGVVLKNHRSQPLTPKLLNKYYWILVMEIAHKEQILNKNPEVGNRVFTVREFGLDIPPDEPDMPDPTFSDNQDDYYNLLNILNYEIPRITRILQIRNSDLDVSHDYNSY